MPPARLNFACEIGSIGLGKHRFLHTRSDSATGILTLRVEDRLE